LVAKPHNKTPYELLTGDKLAIGYLKPFGCQVTILNTSDYIGKFDEKADEGYIVGYSIPEQEGKDAAQRLGLAFPTHVVTHEASSIPAKKSSSVSPVSTPTASAGNTPPVYPRPSAGRSSKSTGKKLASSSKTPIPVDRSISARKSIPADRSVSADKSISADRSISVGKFIPADRSVSADTSISADRSISALRDINSADRHPSKLSSNAVSKRFLPASNTQNSDIHDGLKLFDCPNTGIFSSSSYDDEYHGPDISNQEKEILINPVTTKKDQRRNNHTDFYLCLFSCFLSQMKPTSVAQALLDPDWVEAMQEELYQFQNQRVWVLIELPEGKHAIGTKLFLAFASYMGFMVYQMDVKSAFLNGEIQEEVYVTQPKGFEDPKYPKRVYKVLKLCMVFIRLLELGLQVDQRSDGIFIHQTKYVNDILHKFDMDTNKSAPTPFEPSEIKDKNLPDGPINVYLFRSMIGSLMYLTASRPDITFAGHPKFRLWYPRDSPFDLEAFSDSDYAGAAGNRKST
nr:hypothetical protein [Tanacetum cinerariifolium]